jgi:membrane associated rhomboid family serine protease
MTGICSICGKKEMLPYRCKFCGYLYCSEHRLPENHDCPGLEKLKAQTRDSGRIVYQPVSEPIKKSGIGFSGLGRKKKSPYTVPISRNYSLYIIMVTGLMYFLQLLIPGFTGLFLLIPQLAAERPWTVFTYMFLHGNLIHLFINMLMLLFLGKILERRIGSINFLTVYFGAGLLSALGHMLISPSPVLGASGAVYGIFACLAILEPGIMVYVFPIPFPLKIIHLLVLYALNDLLNIGSNDMIAHAAHLSGLLFGLFMAFKLKHDHSMNNW